MMNLDSLKYCLSKYVNRNLGTILIYHSVIDIPLVFPMWTHMPVALFEEHMRLISREANVVPLEEMVIGLQRGRLPRNAVAVTFDDGFRNNYTRAYPVLQHYNIPATIFLCTGYIGKQDLFWSEKLAYLIMKTKHLGIQNRTLGSFHLDSPANRKVAYDRILNRLKSHVNDNIEAIIAELVSELEVEVLAEDPLYKEWLPLDWIEVNTMEEEGLITFGGHTERHMILSTHPDDEVIGEVRRCKSSLEANLKHSCHHWAHPNGQIGDFSEMHERMLMEEGFHFIYPSIPEYVHRTMPLNRIGRFGIGSNIHAEELRDLLTKRYHLSRYSGFEKIKYIANGLLGRL